ncbi:MAG TPA: PEP/pyruvate-binding domain-containing protein [Patescibacteria group bacterium]|nr:PEP/pyruvate-binding domain-containing protein [Patescibacteria group bacterium]
MRRRSYNPHHTSLTRFDRDFLSGADRFTYIGAGNLGGKAHGLARMKGALESKLKETFAPAIAINIPTLTVITTELFDLFMRQNDLYEIAYSGERDDLVAHAFQRADLPVQLVGDLRALVEQVHTPLAVRSSSLLEDAMFEPFASVYATKMVPNNQPDADTRFHKLIEAVKFVYASTFFSVARNYMKVTHHVTRDEKMAVIIQEVVGSRSGNRFYPHISGVMRSYNFYPTGHAIPEDGVVELALGLGRTIVDDGVSWSYSPAYPRANPPFKSTGDLLKSTQTVFWAINMGKPAAYDPIKETEYMAQYDLVDGEYDGTLRFIASTYLPRDDRITSGTAEKGPRVIDFAPILKDGLLPLNELLKTLKGVCEETLGTMVEIEFAVRFDRKRCTPAEFGFLQVRPMVVSQAEVTVPREELAGERVLLSSETVLGNGTLDTIRDVVFVDPERFDVKESRRIAAELDTFNRTLVDARTPYVLIGFGRWGTTDPLGGIPVNFGQISGAKVIVEASLPNLNVTMSQGSHFFHNVTSFKIFYFSIPHGGEYRIDWEWLMMQRAVSEGQFVRHVGLAVPLIVKVDGRSGRGVILHE